MNDQTIAQHYSRAGMFTIQQIREFKGHTVGLYGVKTEPTLIYAIHESLGFGMLAGRKDGHMHLRITKYNDQRKFKKRILKHMSGDKKTQAVEWFKKLGKYKISRQVVRL